MATYKLPDGISSKLLRVLDLDMHILEALPQSNSPRFPARPPLIILLHGFPELAYSWRKIMVPLAQQGYRVIAPDQRGYGRTVVTGSGEQSQKIEYNEDLTPYTQSKLAKDIIALISVLGYDTTSNIAPIVSIVGHDFGSMVAGWCVLLKPELFARGGIVFMSLPFTGTSRTQVESSNGKTAVQILNGTLSTITPPRKHYTIYLSTPEANSDLLAGFSENVIKSNSALSESASRQSNPSLHTFLRTFYHTKSADWHHGADPHSLLDRDTAKSMLSLSSAPPEAQLKVLQAFASLPYYYVMPLNSSMPEAIISYVQPHNDLRFSDRWLSDEELGVYVSEFSRRGFQGGLNWYRAVTEGNTGLTATEASNIKNQITIPAAYISGKKDWGVYQQPGAVDLMRQMTRMADENFVLLEGAGHWVQQEQSEAVIHHLLRFINSSVGNH
ncbi:Alpha/Beta hydrolase protein [Panaeolus papilionaceus]|nr:Alpha/Beta hydrolase protein [Panaeolus papilionaceus]